jgi:hypothetical protein
MASIGVDAVWHFGAAPSYITYFHVERKAVLADEVLGRVTIFGDNCVTLDATGTATLFLHEWLAASDRMVSSI